jgi:hypothetical protein
MPEIGLGIGAEKQVYAGTRREWLYWYDQYNVRYLTPTERADYEATRAGRDAATRAECDATARLTVEQKNTLFRKRLQKLGIDPDSIK